MDEYIDDVKEYYIVSPGEFEVIGGCVAVFNR